MGLTHLDAGVLIGLFDSSDAHHAASRRVVEAGFDNGERFAVAAPALAESLVGPLRRRGEAAIPPALGALDLLLVQITDITTPIALEAARLRAGHGSLKLPDALVIATAIETEAARLVTTDRRWPTLETSFEIEQI